MYCSLRMAGIMMTISLVFFVYNVTDLFARSPVNNRSAHKITPTMAFGKTHFIDGYPQDQMEKLVVKNKDNNKISVVEGSKVVGKPLFAPDDDVQKKILDLIAHEQACIKIAAYMLNDEQIVQALFAASKRGVAIEIIADGTMIDRFSEITTLRKFPEILIYEYAPQKKSFSASLMHNKYIIFCRNTLDDVAGNGRSLVITGSTNFTDKAYKKNQENMVILEGEVVQHYTQQFNKIKERVSEKKARKDKKNE